ncbi:hypothetical protein ACTFIY_012431 [Dictyostelium cf. discoideum]
MTKKLEKINKQSNVSKTIITKAQIDQKMRNEEAEKLYWIFKNKVRPIDYSEIIENTTPRKTSINREKVESENNGQNISRLNDLTDITFWKFITDYLKNIYSNKNNDKIPPELINLKMMDHNRYSAIHNVLDMKSHRFEEYCELFMNSALKYINIGIVLNCDETIYAYYGKDAIKDHILINNDIICYGPRTPENCQSPFNSLKTLLDNLHSKYNWEDSRNNLIVCCDSAFALVNNKACLDELKCRILSSTRKSGVTVAQEIKRFVKSLLTTHKTFLFYDESTGLLYEYTKNTAGHINCIATNLYSRYSNPYVEINNTLNIEQFFNYWKFISFFKKRTGTNFLDSTQGGKQYDKSKNYSKKELQDLKTKVIGTHQNRSQMIHDQYIFWYNLVDITDKRYYATIRECKNPENQPPEIIQTINEFVESLIFQFHELKELQ